MLQLKIVTKRLWKSAFVKNILVVMSGTAAAQALGFAAIPLISRLFSPTDFGILGSFSAYLTVIAAGVTLDYSQAIMLPKNKDTAFNIFILSCVSTVIVTACCLIVILLIPDIIQNIMNFPSTWMTVLFVVAILTRGLNQTCMAWCVRIKAFKHTSTSQVIRSLSCNGTQLALGFIKSEPLSLVYGVILGEVAACFNLIRVLLPDLKRYHRNIRWVQIKKLAFDYRDFPMYSASKNIINALSSGLPVILLTHFYGLAVAGAYAFGFRVVGVPMEFVLRPLRQVLFQKASETQHQGGSLASLYVKVTAGLFALAFFPSLVLFIWAPQLFSWIFGPQWLTAGEFAKIMIIWLSFAFCNLPAMLFARLIRFQRFVFFYDLWLLAARTLALIFGGLYLTALQAVMLYAIVGAAMNTLLIFWVGYAVIKKERPFFLKSIWNFLIIR